MKIELNPGERVEVVCGDEAVSVLRTNVRGAMRVVRIASGARVPPFDEDRGVVKVRLHSDRLCAYYCPGAKIGDTVRVVLPSGLPHYTRVVDFGRGGYTGTLKSAELVPR